MEARKNTIVQWSHLFFLLPLAISLSFGMTSYSSVLVAMLCFSLLFHGTVSSHFAILDKAFAHLLILSNVVLVFRGNFQYPYFLAVCLLIPISFFFLYRKGNYAWNHSLWHVISAYICIFSELVYLLGK